MSPTMYWPARATTQPVGDDGLNQHAYKTRTVTIVLGRKIIRGSYVNLYTGSQR
jgi:hypothetical protein